MSTETYYKFNTAGECLRVTVQEQGVRLQKDLLAKFTDDRAIPIPELIDAGILGDGASGKIGMMVRSKFITFTIPVNALPMRAAFAMKGEVLVPDFSADITVPTMELKWQVPEGMRVFLVVNSPKNESYIQTDIQWLIALDQQGRIWRLPTSNCYEDCRLCAGIFDSIGATYIDMLGKAWRQFISSRWQKDLIGEGGGLAKSIAHAQAMFRYKPLGKDEGGGFQQLPIEGDWTSLCTKVGSEHLNNNILI